LEYGATKRIQYPKRKVNLRIGFKLPGFQPTIPNHDRCVTIARVGRPRPIAYASRILNKAEQNYNTTEKELLAMGDKTFPTLYYYGTKFLIITDHKPLIWLFSVNDPGSRLIRLRLKLEEYDYAIIHRAEKDNANADALS